MIPHGDTDQWQWRNHPSNCLCFACRDPDRRINDTDEDNRTGQAGAVRHRPADCRFHGD